MSLRTSSASHAIANRRIRLPSRRFPLFCKSQLLLPCASPRDGVQHAGTSPCTRLHTLRQPNSKRRILPARRLARRQQHFLAVAGSQHNTPSPPIYGRCVWGLAHPSACHGCAQFSANAPRVQPHLSSSKPMYKSTGVSPPDPNCAHGRATTSRTHFSSSRAPLCTLAQRNIHTNFRPRIVRRNFPALPATQPSRGPSRITHACRSSARTPPRIRLHFAHFPGYTYHRTPPAFVIPPLATECSSPRTPSAHIVLCAAPRRSPRNNSPHTARQLLTTSISVRALTTPYRARPCTPLL